MSGHHIGDDDYVSYFVNELGERMIFVREPGKRHAIFLHSDLDWEPKLIEGPPTIGAGSQEISPEARRFLGDVPVVGDTILSHPEALWLKACLAASDRR